MAIKNVGFAPASFGRSGGGSFTDTLRQNRADKENARRYEIAQQRLARQDAIAVADRAAQNARLSTADSRAQTVFDQNQEDRNLGLKAAEIAGAVTPTSPYDEVVTPTQATRTPEELAAISGAYQGEAGNELLGQDPRAQIIEQRLAELTPQIENAPIESGKEQIAQAGTNVDPSRLIPGAGAVQSAAGIIGNTYDAAKDWYNGTPPVDPVEAAVLTPFQEKEKLFAENTKEFNDLTKEYTGLDADVRKKKASEVLANVGATYEKNITEVVPRTAQGFRKAQIDSINETMKKEGVDKKDQARIRASVLKTLDPRAIAQGKIAAQYRKDKAAERTAEISAKGKVKETATTQREKSNTQYYKNQEADLKRLDNERSVLAKLYSDDKFSKEYLAKDSALKAQQQRIRDTLKKQ